MCNILSVYQLTKYYKTNLAVNNVSFDIKSGGYIYGLLGPNGSGKSTVLGIIMGAVSPSSGSVIWEGISAQKAVQNVGAMVNQPQFYPYLSLKKNMQIVCKIKHWGAYSNQYLDKVGLLEHKNKHFGHLSFGMKQRFALACALIRPYRLLILDEPTNGLDPQGIAEVRAIIREVANNGTSVLMASHQLDEVEKTCSRIIVLQNGEKRYEGEVKSALLCANSIEIESQNMPLLKDILKNTLNINFKEVTPKRLSLSDNDISPESLNETLYKHGVILSHLSQKKSSLEDLFFQITHNQKL